MPIRGRKVKSGYAVRSAASSAALRWLTQIGVERQLGGDHVGHQPVHLGEVGAVGQRQVQRDPLDPGLRVGAHDLGRRPQLAGASCRGAACWWCARARSGHRADDASRSVRSSTRLTVWMTRPAIAGSTSMRRAERTPRGEHEQAAVVPAGDLRAAPRRCRPRGCRRPETLVVQPLRLAGEPAEGEAVAVALGDRDQPGLGRRDRAQVVAPAVTVDGEGEAHRRPLSSCRGRTRRRAPC